MNRILPLGVAVLLLGGVGVHHYRNQVETNEALAKGELLSINRLKARQIETWRAERMADAQVLVGNRLLSEALVNWLLAKANRPATADVEASLVTLTRHYGYQSLLLIDATGKTRLGVGDAESSLDAASLADLQQTFRTRSVLLTDIRQVSGPIRHRLTLVAPLFAGESPAGAIVLLIDPDRQLFPLLEEPPRQHQTMESVLVSRQGESVEFLSRLRFESEAPADHRDALARETGMPAVQAVLGNTGIVEGTDQRGVPVVSAIQPVDGTSWFLITQIDRAEFYKSLLHDERLLAAALAAMLVLMGLLGYALQTRQRYLRSRHSLDEEIEYRRGEQRFHDLFDQMPEPVWIVRGTRFIEANSAAMAAIGYARRPDFLDLHPGEVSPEFQPDGQPFRQKAEEMVRIAQEEGIHRFEWVHQRVDGSVFPVEVTLTTMEWEGQPAICCIWRDISERQALWQRVQASEARFRALFESSNDAILLESGQAFLDCNPRALQLFGLESREQLVGLHPADLSPTLLPDGRDAKSAADAFVREAIETGRCLFEWTSRKRDGSLFPSEVLLSSFRLGDEVFLQARVRDLTDEKRAMRNLRDSEARFRTLFESSNDAIMLLKDGCFEDCNEKTLQLFGFSGKEAIIGRRPDALSPDFQPDGQASATLAVARYQQAVAEGEAHFEWRHRRADGREFPADILLSRYRMGEAVWIQATVRDITELKAAETALRASEANLRRAQAVANVGSWTFEMPEDRLVWSEQTYRIFGVEPGMPLTYEDFVQFIHPEDRARVEQAWQAALQGAPYSIEHRILVNGEERWVQEQADLRVDEHGGLVAGIGTVQDITPRKQAELALQSLNQELERRVAERTAELENLTRHLRAGEAAALSQSQRLRDVIWGADIGTWELHVPSGQVVISERWASMLGYSLAELEPTRIDTWRQLTEPTDLQRAEAILKRCFARQLDHYECELRMRHKGGDWVWVLDRGRVVEWSTEGQPLRMSGTHQDITDRKRAEQAIRDLNRNLEQKVAERTAQLEVAGRAKSEFLANMSHEIRTPMNAILGLAQLLESEPLSADQRDLLRKINDSGQCLLHVINDVLDFSKIEAGQLRLENQPFELAPVLFRLESLLGHLAQENALILDVNPPVGVPGRLLGDPLRIGQVLLNLASNAVKFTERGRVTVRVRVLSASNTACRLRFEVRDTGIGIEPDTLDRLFQPFTQADASTTRRFGGTGLGLSISKHLVERMGGRIGAESTPGQGSLFWFELPLERSESEQQGESAEFRPLEPVAPKPMSRQPRLSGLRILAVDDNRMNLFLLERMLRGEGAEVGLCADGQQAVETLKASPSAYDVVLMDIQMPVMDGIAATRALRRHPATAVLPASSPRSATPP